MLKRFLGLACFFLPTAALAQSPDLNEVEEIQVSMRRLPDSIAGEVYSATELGRTDLDGAAVTLDDALRQVPGYGLFRRQSSLAAHPTTQGVSLRGLGPNGAGRTLVLVDGVPQNDPFGGWIDWSRLPPPTIDAVSVVRSGGAGPWGNAALAGVIRIQTRSEETVADARGGSRESVAATVLSGADLPWGRIDVTGYGRDTDGYFVVPLADRGDADRPQSSAAIGARVRATIEGETTLFDLTGSASRSRLINGADDARVITKTVDAAASILRPSTKDGPALESHIYIRHTDFSSVFTAFDDERNEARPVLDQFDVPGTAFGGNLIARWADSDVWELDIGADARFSDGETNERFLDLGQGFVRQRTAGGKQSVAGLFAESHWQATDTAILTAGVRIDYWRQTSGVRREIDLPSAAVLRDDQYQNRSGWVVNGRLGGAIDLTSSLKGRAAAYSGFRIPTLNELYRPFRVGNDITEANPALSIERLAGIESGFDWQKDSYTGSLTVFRNDLFDPIANITVSSQPGFNGDLGVFVPQGGVLRQRRNVDRARVRGLEADLNADVGSGFSLGLSYLYSDAKIAESGDDPSLIGKRLAQVPRHQGRVSTQWDGLDRLQISLGVSLVGDQYEDDLNTRKLDGYAAFDGTVTVAITDTVSGYVAAENLFDTTIEAGRSADGLVSLGPPMILWVGLRLHH